MRTRWKTLAYALTLILAAAHNFGFHLHRWYNNNDDINSRANFPIIANMSQHTTRTREFLNVAGKTLCFIHVGKTGGSSFRSQFAEGKKTVSNLNSLPMLETWREVHTAPKLVFGDVAKCDFFVTWVRDPIDRAVSAYNMDLDPLWGEELRRFNRKGYNHWVERVKHLRRFGNLNNLTEQLLVNGEAAILWEGIEHVGHDIAWYFSYDAETGNPTKPGRGAHSGARSYLQNEEFLKKLVFVGANECYNEDIDQFASIFGVSTSFMSEHPVVHERRKHAGAFDSQTLSPTARDILENYFYYDYVVLHLLKELGFIKCQKLLDRISHVYKKYDWASFT
eukprot:CAMPEP_0183735144 /NCGR_PEP_ID=MMETSP0737-20130205/45836_1 /TAXON_ID=385413 /ORGANISM="Thalassiosira miniscula, Strain CCMP1093" /LENGTH=335 /DNA_ID=CAMNT_0025968803 /DNA_START=1 /DNA_END=1011 /DNA_ORIENTATION=+